MTQLGRYQLKSVLGRGAMGMVYEALDPRLERRVAIKTILKSHLLDDAVAQDYSRRFVREAQAAARLNHPHIVTVFDFGEEEEVAYIVMEFIEGHELAQHFEAHDFFTVPEAVRILCELLDALAYAHERGIVHRDVKPANVMIDRAGRVKLTDFGVARLAETNADRTLPGTMVGTPSYMSPEQIQGQAVGSRTDLFAVGVILYQFLAHQRPFSGGGQWAVQRKILHEDPPPPSQLNPASPRIFDAIALRALAKNPDHRFQSAVAFASELQLALETLPTVAKPRPAPDLDITVMVTKPRPTAPAATATPRASALPAAPGVSQPPAPTTARPAPIVPASTASTASAPGMMTRLDLARAPSATWMPPSRATGDARGSPAPPQPSTAARSSGAAGTPTVSPYARRRPSWPWLAGLVTVAGLPLALLLWQPAPMPPAVVTKPVPARPASTPADAASRPARPSAPASLPPARVTQEVPASTSMPSFPATGPSPVPRGGDNAGTDTGSTVRSERRAAAAGPARATGARCAELMQRLQLGETLSPEHLEIFQKECKR